MPQTLSSVRIQTQITENTLFQPGSHKSRNQVLIKSFKEMGNWIPETVSDLFWPTKGAVTLTMLREAGILEAVPGTIALGTLTLAVIQGYGRWGCQL